MDVKKDSKKIQTPVEIYTKETCKMNGQRDTHCQGCSV